jgi:hypothetical protein
MKIEFHPDFNFRIDFKVIWPRFKGFLKNLSFKPERYPQVLGKLAVVIAAGLALILIVVIILGIISASR